MRQTALPIVAVPTVVAEGIAAIASCCTVAGTRATASCDIAGVAVVARV
jgi:hypothetical protein